MSLNQMVGKELARRVLPEGGLADHFQGQFRVDATIWGILALDALGADRGLLERHRARLIGEQGEDGRVWFAPQHPESIWPTALAILAWQDSPVSQVAQRSAVNFLLATTGRHPSKTIGDPWAHDTTLKGWPWIEDTQAWVEPTAVSLMALRVAGYAQHERVREAIRMVLDRQLPHGGWNAGNTLVFGRELHPNPEGTGAALTGIAGVVDQEKIARSLEYLHGEVNRLRTPISLGWALLGLRAWQQWPSNGGLLVERCLENQARYGEYDTSALCLLCLGALAGKANKEISLFTHSQDVR